MIVLFLALGLAMDAFVASITCGMNIADKKYKILEAPLIFGTLQGALFGAGYLLAESFKWAIESFDHWIGFFILLYIGIKMIRESFEVKVCNMNIVSFKNLVILGIATSIDAAAAGVSFTSMNINFINSSLIIGAVTAFLCFIGIILGEKFSKTPFISKYMEILGGLILIGIGFKILLGHLIG